MKDVQLCSGGCRQSRSLFTEPLSILLRRRPRASTLSRPSEDDSMRSACVKGGLRRLCLPRVGTSNVNSLSGMTHVPRGGLTFRNFVSCVSRRPAPRTSLVAPSSSLSSLVPTTDGCSGDRSVAMLDCVHNITGDVNRRRSSQVKLALMKRPRFSATAAPASAVLGHSSVLGTWSRSFSTSTDGASKKLEVLDGAHVAEADVAEVMEPTKEEPRHAHIEMPSITDVGTGCQNRRCLQRAR